MICSADGISSSDRRRIRLSNPARRFRRHADEMGALMHTNGLVGASRAKDVLAPIRHASAPPQYDPGDFAGATSCIQAIAIQEAAGRADRLA